MSSPSRSFFVCRRARRPAGASFSPPEPREPLRLSSRRTFPAVDTRFRPSIVYHGARLSSAGQESTWQVALVSMVPGRRSRRPLSSSAEGDSGRLPQVHGWHGLLSSSAV
ncbi:hypothetical protein VPH35_140897 [Triticum aestivum]|uniref:uncharacterized protein n=1 Tax=Triticum aestivum TaxID=4565 RepID=UPI001D00F5B4|nr:uncharacterized protein LOC123164035 [Triticum aestivum]